MNVNVAFYLRMYLAFLEMIPQGRLVTLQQSLELQAQGHYALRAGAHSVQPVPVPQIERSKDVVKFDGVVKEVAKWSG